MIAVLEHERAAVLHGDSSQLGEVLAPDSIDAIITDPPAGIDFMGKGWDGDKGGRNHWIAWLAQVLRPAYVALKPGGHGLVWALPRTSHWTATALEDLGFEIRDIHHHLFGTGFPKSLTHNSAEIPEWAGTALKPACEHWILVRKPLAGNVAANFAQHGTGVLNIGGCRIGDGGIDPARMQRCRTAQTGDTVTLNVPGHEQPTYNVAGRWPAHVSFDEEAAAVLDGQSGEQRARGNKTAKDHGANYNATSYCFGGRESGNGGDTGGASRFFYVAKGARSEKDAGLSHLPARSGGEATGRDDGSAGTQNPRAGAGRTGGARNFHPTVKSIALMRWLCRLITPPGGTVLDPFAGSGSTGVAALAEGFNFIGCELTDEYIPIIVGRIRHALGTAEHAAPAATIETLLT